MLFRSDIPNRAKRHFSIMNVTLPSVASINQIFGSMIKAQFDPEAEYKVADVWATADKLVEMTIEIWDKVKAKMLPTPAKFHYIFNLRELSRIFQGILLADKDVIMTGGQQMTTLKAPQVVLRLWVHECERVFCDKLTNNADKDRYQDMMKREAKSVFGEKMVRELEETFFVNFFRDPTIDPETEELLAAPKVYEPGGALTDIRDRVNTFLVKYNEVNQARQMNQIGRAHV